MARKKIRLSTGVVFFGLLLTGNVLLFLPQEKTKKINYFFMRNSAPVINAVSEPDPARKQTVPVEKYKQLVKAYNTLTGQLDTILDVNARLSGFRTKLPQPGPMLVIAKVINCSIDGQRNELHINKGSLHKLGKGQYVLSYNVSQDNKAVVSVIGSICELSKNMSRVKLVTDCKHNMPIHISRTGENWKVSGLLAGNNKLAGSIPKLSWIDNKDIKVGDIIFASDRAGYLNTPLPVGTVTQAKPDIKEPSLWDIKVMPIDNYQAITDVAVVVFDPDEIKDKKD